MAGPLRNRGSIEPDAIFNEWMALDFISNAAMLALCVIGYSRSGKAPA